MSKGLLSFYKPSKNFHLEMVCQQKISLDALEFRFSPKCSTSGSAWSIRLATLYGSSTAAPDVMNSSHSPSFKAPSEKLLITEMQW